MERPVVFVGESAVIARPSEKVLDLLAEPGEVTEPGAVPGRGANT